jgi:hypothetical protein
MTEVVFPSLSTENAQAEGVVATWFVTDGEHVEADQLLAEVQVDKVAVEVPAPVDGSRASGCDRAHRPVIGQHVVSRIAWYISRAALLGAVFVAASRLAAL